MFNTPWFTAALSNKIAELRHWNETDPKDVRIMRGLIRPEDQLTKK